MAVVRSELQLPRVNPLLLGTNMTFKSKISNSTIDGAQETVGGFDHYTGTGISFTKEHFEAKRNKLNLVKQYQLS